MPGIHSDLLERHRRVMPSWLSLYYDEPIEIVSGTGCTVVDGEGRTYLDLFGGILTTMTGYNVEEVVDAIREQAAKLLHSSTLYLIRPMVDLAERIAALAPMPDAKVFFVSSGSEANEAALLLCATARGSNEVLALRNSYHGRSFATMAVTGNRSWSASSLSPFRVSYVHNADRFRSPFGNLDDEALVAVCADDLRNVIDTTTSGDVACMIAEPIQGVGGFVVPPDGFFRAMKDVLDEHGILFVADEVQTGWGRTGESFWGIQAHDVEPDLVTFAKGLGNGLAIGGVVGRSELVDSVHASSISTFGGNPLSCAGALANLEYLLGHDLQANASRAGKMLRDALEPLVGRLGVVGDVRGKGLMIGVELVEPGTKRPAPAAAARALEHARDQGVLVGKGGLYGNTLRIAPPLSISSAEVAVAIDVLVSSLEAVEREVSTAP